MNKTKDHKKLLEIVFLQTLGPLLVIYGHALNGLPYNQILNSLKSYIYTFHMPLFFFISGVLFIYTNSNDICYSEFIKKKTIRLLIPYFFWNLLFIVPKYFLSSYLSDKVSLSLKEIVKMFIYPRNNIWGHTWFLVAIFIVYCTAPFIKKLYDNHPKLFTCILLIFYLISMFASPYLNTFLFTISDLAKDYVFFLIGIFIVAKKDKILKYDKLVYLLVIISSVLWIVYNNNITSCLLCTNMLISLYLLGIRLVKITKENEISKNSMTVYLLHWPFMIATRIVVYQLLHFNYYLTVSLMFLIGILGPIITILIVDKLRLRERFKFIKIVLG